MRQQIENIADYYNAQPKRRTKREMLIAALVKAAKRRAKRKQGK